MMSSEEGAWEAVRINRNLTRKYDIHFNFFLTKPTNEIIYNHTCAPTTIDFKDTAILADSNQYLKRYYFLENSLKKKEIYDRIQLLAEFYTNAVLLRYEYPLMILTNTKSIFLKRLKRIKKILVEEGSSDESKSHNQDKAVSINSSNFLKSIDSSELQRKSFDEREHLQLDFSVIDDEPQTYDIYCEDEPQQPFQNSLLLSNITKFTRQIACQLVLEKEQSEEELSHLTLDFDEFDGQYIMKQYRKMMEKENRMAANSVRQSMMKKDLSGRSQQINGHPQRFKDLMERKPMATSITITALQDQQQHTNHLHNNQSTPFTQNDYFKKKSMMGPRMSENPTNNFNHPVPPIKRSSFYQYELDHRIFPLSNQYNEFAIAEDQGEQSPKNGTHPLKFPTEEQKDRRYTNIRGYTARESQIANHTDRPWGLNSPKTKYSSILNKDDFKTRSKIFSSDREASERVPPFSFKNFQHPQDEHFSSYAGRYGSISPQNRMTSINININNLQEKKEQHRVNVKVNNKNKYEVMQDYKQQERNYRAEKKRKIREKAAALLNRVKSQEYMRPMQEQYEYEENNGNYYGKYYG